MLDYIKEPAFPPRRLLKLDPPDAAGDFLFGAKLYRDRLSTPAFFLAKNLCLVCARWADGGLSGSLRQADAVARAAWEVEDLAPARLPSYLDRTLCAEGFSALRALVQLWAGEASERHAGVETYAERHVENAMRFAEALFAVDREQRAAARMMREGRRPLAASGASAHA